MGIGLNEVGTFILNNILMYVTFSVHRALQQGPRLAVAAAELEWHDHNYEDHSLRYVEDKIDSVCVCACEERCGPRIRSVLLFDVCIHLACLYVPNISLYSPALYFSRSFSNSFSDYFSYSFSFSYCFRVHYDAPPVAVRPWYLDPIAARKRGATDNRTYRGHDRLPMRYEHGPILDPRHVSKKR